ncbi:copper-transporting ATPase PAA1, chloroplastic isoform X2 [Actinidia eriantha]|uniref:copper-transporting ATPase PAA1, chloroplastic isoform X2 n=1 Tax=Actinidia eriantha TaxID=165200 RepID=UPI0025872E30|nr:copper-transporting ATPase PAA1, chloroplastic isoform X2 [Actinidia eriantha]
MESTFSTTTSLLSMAKTLNPSPNPLVARLHRHLSSTRPGPLASLQLRRPFTAAEFRRPKPLNSVCYSSNSLRSLCGVGVHRLGCVGSSVASFASVAGGDGGTGGSGGSGGGDGASDGGEAESNSVVGGAEEVSALSPDVIILDVRGMTCGGCAASVKRILESQSQVSSASVNLATETAIVWPVSEAKVIPNWQNQLGETLAKHLTSCGFKSNLRDSVKDNFFEVFERKMDEKHKQLKESGRGLAVSWALCAVCLFGHLSHFFGAKASWIHAFHSTGFHFSLSTLTLLGPGRQLIIDGLKSLIRGTPNMNTLVGLGALSSFAVSSLASLIPKLGWKSFFEEPIMLIAFVLLGRNLEQRAKIKATSDMTGLLSALPAKARLLVKGDLEESSSTVEVPCNNLSVGDHIVVLPGDRVPADGIVRAGRSAVDESSFTGEPLPVTKLPGAEVAAGTINLNGTLTVEVQRSGGETAMGDIVRLVEEAQSREAPVQRLADKVAGHFTYGVMALSAATFLFWNLFGARMLPAALHQGSTVSLALQLSCSVLVVACPCALGLATPTAVLVGTSLGATRGLLLRGGNVLEKFAMVDTIVFDKTGTLTIGRPVVTKVETQRCTNDKDSQWSELEVLKLAAGVESNTIHPIGKAIVEAARAANCKNVKVLDGTFREEPGSGAVATIENKRVSVGTVDWVQRHGVIQSPPKELDDLKNQSVVYVGVDGTLAGLIYIEDQIREDAKLVVESLSKQGVSLYMLSGDKRSTAEYVASMVGIPTEKVICGVKPDEKKKFIRKLQKSQSIVAMVGDGINDAAALASSHVGVAMGGGVGAASEVSSIVLMGNRLSQLLDALELSRLTMKTVKQNLWWAFAYNMVGIPIAAGMLLPVTGTMLTPSIAGALMGFSSIGVMSNSLLLRFKFTLKQKNSVDLLQITTHSDSNHLVDEKDKLNRPCAAGS